MGSQMAIPANGKDQSKPKHKEVVESSITRKVLTAESRLYDAYMKNLTNPETLDNDYAMYQNILAQCRSDRPSLSSQRRPPRAADPLHRHNREELKQINENSPQRKPPPGGKKGRRRLNIRLADLETSCAAVPVVVQSTQLEFTLEARALIEGQRRGAKVFDTIVDSANNFRGSVAIRHQDYSKKAPTFDRVSLLPPSAFMRVISFLVDRFRLYLCVNPSWHSATVTAFDEAWNGVENGFVQRYGKFLLFKDSYTSSSVISCADAKGVRVDRVIRCENLPATVGSTFIIGYTYRYCGEGGTTYKSVYKFDSVERKDKLVWIYRNQCFVSSFSTYVVSRRRRRQSGEHSGGPRDRFGGEPRVRGQLLQSPRLGRHRQRPVAAPKLGVDSDGEHPHLSWQGQARG